MTTSPATSQHNDPAEKLRLACDGARNLLVNCAGVRRGDKLLVVGESGPRAHYDSAVCEVVADQARALGANVRLLIAPETRGPEDFPACVSDAMAWADKTIFIARLGDQLRFCPLPGEGSKTMCYLPDIDYLADAFGRTHFEVFREVEARLQDEIRAARSYRLTCPLGSDLRGEISVDALAGSGDDLMTPFTVDLFPMMIFPPVTCRRMSGQLVLSGWLTSSSTHVLEDPVLKLDSPVVAHVENGRIAGFDGTAGEVARTRAHFERVGAEVGGDPMAVNSWHTGINPRTFFKGIAADDVERWGDIAYGSPRFTHFHACGSDPGDVAIMLLDATISFDDTPFWKDGRFVYLDRPDVAAIAHRYPGSEHAFEMRRDIGV